MFKNFKINDRSLKNWQQVTNDRNASNDRNNAAFRENLGGVQPYANPFGEDRKVELPLTYQHYWMDRQGNVVGTHDPNSQPEPGFSQRVAIDEPGQVGASSAATG